MPSGVFAIEQEFDTQYVLAPIEFVREMLSYDNQITSIEIKLKPEANHKKVQQDFQNILGDDFNVQNRYQQNESLYRTMKSEKLVIGLILTLILIIASFNIVGTLSMLIIEKRKDAETLRSLGANKNTIQNIFLAEGVLISMAGTIIGAALGILICWLQIKFGIVKLQGSGQFIIDAYPVDIQPLDITLILILVFTIGLLAARFPVRIITNRILSQQNIGNH